MKRNVSLALAATFALATLLPGRAGAERYTVVPGEPNSVKFVSKAPMETVEGRTRQASGTIDVDPDNLADSVGVRVEVDLASLDTGIGLRNQHMRENHLETDSYPKVVFRGARVAEAESRTLAPGRTVKILLEGDFDLHGVVRRMLVPVQVTRTEHGGRPALRVRAEFAVKLSDHKIARPSFLVMKLDETQRITVDLVAVASGGGGTSGMSGAR
jgi:polyisoprenoid-binding protein YceI